MRVAIDFEGEGLLDGAGSGPAREARRELLQTLENEGFSLDDLRRAAREDRLALLPIERVLEREGPRYTQREVAEAAGVDPDFLREARRALGEPDVGFEERVLTDADLELARQARILLESGLEPRRLPRPHPRDEPGDGIGGLVPDRHARPGPDPSR